MMTNVLLEKDSLATRDGCLTFDLRLPWYRSLPLSVIRIDEVRIDGARMTDLRFEVNGKIRPVSELEDLTGEYWFVQDSLTILTDIPARGTHGVDITLSFYPPYIANFRRKTRGIATMEAA